MLLSAVSILVVAQSISEIPEGLTNNPVQLTHDFHPSFSFTANTSDIIGMYEFS